jgi:hypothetical protein
MDGYYTPWDAIQVPNWQPFICQHIVNHKDERIPKKSALFPNSAKLFFTAVHAGKSKVSAIQEISHT